MDGLTFVTELVKAIAWPASSITLVIILRKPLTELIPFLRKLKYKELELEFTKEVLELKAEVNNDNDESEPIEKSQELTRLESLALLSPRAAILEAWIEVETCAANIASSFWQDARPQNFRNMVSLGDYLLKCKVINPKQHNYFHKLRSLRNKAAHAEELNLTDENAMTYIKLALELIQHIKNYK